MTKYAAGIEHAITELAEFVIPTITPGELRSMGAALVARMTSDERADLAADRLIDVARERSRELTKAREEEATRRQFGTRKIRHGSVAQRDGGVTFGCSCDLCSEALRREEAHLDRLVAATRKIVVDYVEMLRVEWTNELLASTFALPDGTVVTWGSATLDQHRARAEQFEHHAITDMKTAAMHRKAIATIEEHSAGTLDDLLQLVAS